MYTMVAMSLEGMGGFHQIALDVWHNQAYFTII
jgi:hypothetical protein